MKKEAKKATITGIVANCFLFLIKIFAGIVYNSIALISDAFNSLTDIVASIVVFIGVKVSAKKADKDHPFGHHRAEPIAAFIVAIFIVVVGFEIITAAIDRFLSGERLIPGIIPLVVILITFLLKLVLYFYFKKVGRKLKSPAILASSIDHRNDVLISVTIFIGVGLANIGYHIFDPLVAFIVGLYIIKSGYDIGADNIKYLMGVCPDKKLLEKILAIAKSIQGVRNVHDVRAHYVGVNVHVEVHIKVNRKLSIEKAHAIGKKVQNKLESLENIDRSFVHIDPV